MGFFGLEKLRIEIQSLQGKLRVISLVVFIFPFTILLYILYQQGFFSSPDPLHRLIFLIIAALAFAGIMLLRQAFNTCILESVFMKKTVAGETTMMDMPKDAAGSSEISTSFNRLITRLVETGRQLEQLDGEDDEGVRGLSQKE